MHRFLGKCQKKYGGCGQGLATTTDTTDSLKWVTCTNCGGRVMLKRVQGELNPGHKCDPRCTGATGTDCSCACGGANHGSDHDMQDVVVAASRTAREPVESKHIGQVSKYVCGFVTVTRKTWIEKADKTLYMLKTDGGDTIKWFAPMMDDPNWNRGDRFKMRAKVTKHEDHPKFGKSTLVMHAEKKED